MEKTGFFEEAPGRQSWMRLSGTFLLALAGFIIIYDTIHSKEYPVEVLLILIGTAITGKFIQKLKEVKPE